MNGRSMTLGLTARKESISAAGRHRSRLLWFGVLLLCPAILAGAAESPVPIPWSELGTAAGKQYQGDGLGVTATDQGAVLKCAFQRLEGEVTPDGLWLTSTAPEQAGEKFSIKAASVGRVGSVGRELAGRGVVQTEAGLARLVRPDLVEEYSVSVDGVRQDFVVLQSPLGAGDLRVELALTGAKAKPAGNGAQLILDGTGRKLAYNRLKVLDATDRELTARFEIGSPSLLAVVVNDTGAVYPLRIDPTFSDANWVSLGGIPGLDGNVYTAVVDTHSGKIYVGGIFTVAGETTAKNIAQWDGSAWSAMGSGITNFINALAVDEAGNVYAGGPFTTAGGVSANYIAKWDGSTWSAMGSGMNQSVYALAVDQSGNVYAGGIFTTAGGNAASRIAKWNGTTWSALGSGTDVSVGAVAVDGAGNVYAGGPFTTAGGTAASRIAKWNGSAWSPLGSGMNSTVYALALDNATNVYAGGYFTTAGGVTVNKIAKWNGSAWSALGSGMNSTAYVYALAVDESGNVHAGGDFTTAGGIAANRIAKWDGSAWSTVSSGMEDTVRALALDGSENVYAAGYFKTVGGVTVNKIGKWDGSVWSSLGSGMNNYVYALAVDGAGNVYAGGTFTPVGTRTANRVAKWDGSTWSALGAGVDNGVRALAIDSSTNLYAGGMFTNAGGLAANYIAKWDGSTWAALGSGMNNFVQGLVVDKSDHVFAGGNFTTAGGITVNYVAQWDGSTWSALGSGMDANSVQELALDKAGNLYAGGGFTQAGGVAASRIAKWNGSAWSALGAGVNNFVYGLAVDAATNVYASGNFTTAGGIAAAYVAKWNGSAWSAMGSGMNVSGVNAMTVDGSGNVYAGGTFTTAGGTPALVVAKWNGSAWEALGSGLNSTVYALTADGAGNVYAGGYFTKAGGKAAGLVAMAANSASLLVQTGTMAFDDTEVNQISPVQSYTVAGAVLTADIVITSPSGFEVSTNDGSGFESSVTLAQSDGIVEATPIYVRFMPDEATSYSGNITHTSLGAPTQNKRVTGTGTGMPYTAPVLTTPTATSIGQANATLGATVTTNGGATLTARGTLWGTTASPTGNTLAEGGTVTGVFSHVRTGLPAGTLVYFRGYAVNSVGTNYSEDGSFWTVPANPVANAATAISESGFAANWSHSTGATNYLLDVAADESFTSYVSGYQDLNVGDATTHPVAGLSPGQTYYYRVRAQNSGGASENSGTTTVLVDKAVADVTLGSLRQTYNGMERLATATTTPEGLTVDFTYDGSPTVPTAIGSYAVIGTVNDVMFQGTGTGTLVVSKAELTVAGAVAQDKPYDGNNEAQILGATLVGVVGLDDVTLANATTGTFAQVGVGTDIAVATAPMTITGDDTGNYTLIQPTGLKADISPATARVDLLNLTGQVYDGTPKTVLVSTDPEGLTVDVTYDGSATAPIAAGSYAVTGTVNEANYEGSASGTLVIDQADQSIGDFLPADASHFFQSDAAGLGATASSGLGVIFTVFSGPGHIEEATLTFTGVGEVKIVATQSGNGNYNAAPEVTHTYTVHEDLAFELSRTAVNVREAGEGRFFVRLAAAPLVKTTITVSRVDGDASLAVQSGATLVFKPSNWSVWQAVTLGQVADSGNSVNEQATFAISMAGEEDQPVVATALDVEGLGSNLALATTGSTISGSYATRAIDGLHAYSTNYGHTIWTPDPKGSMVLDLKDAATVSRIRLLNWDWGYRVHQYKIEKSLNGTDWTPLVDSGAGAQRGWDDWAVASESIQYLKFTGLSNSVNNAVCVAELEVYGTPALKPAPLVNKAAVNVLENGEGRFFVKLARKPGASTLVTVAPAEGGDADLTVKSGGTLTFTPANWSIWQAMTLQAVNDLDAANGSGTINISASGSLVTEVTATELDDDISGSNLALASTITGGNLPARTIDGLHMDSANYGYSTWTSVPPGAITMDLKAVATVTRIRLLNWDWSYRVHQYKIESSLDGSSWTELVNSGAGAQRGWDDWEVAHASIRYLKFTGLNNSINPAVCVSEWQVYGTVAGRRSLVSAKSPARRLDSAPASVLTSDGPEDQTGWNAVDGDSTTAWIGRKAGGGYLVIEYQPALKLSALEVDLAEGSLGGAQCLYSLDAKDWQLLPEDRENHPVSLNFLWMLFPDDGTAAVPGVLEIRPNP